MSILPEKNGVRKDRYFSIRYKLHGKDKEEGIGWASEGWNAQKASAILAGLKEAHRTGKGPQTLTEQREQEYAKREEEKRQKELDKKNAITLNQFFGLRLTTPPNYWFRQTVKITW